MKGLDTAKERRNELGHNLQEIMQIQPQKDKSIEKLEGKRHRIYTVAF